MNVHWERMNVHWEKMNVHWEEWTYTEEEWTYTGEEWTYTDWYSTISWNICQNIYFTDIFIKFKIFEYFYVLKV